jgi:Fur family ferric uptake transcriptional regulator
MPRTLGPKRRQALVDELHTLGLRATPARVGVLDAIRSVDAPVTHAELAERVRGNGWDAATVYRNLMTLVEAGVVARTDHGDRRWRFEAVRIDEPRHEHPHFFCTDCGTVSCLPEVKVQLRRTMTLPRSARSHHVEVQLRGVCDDCGAE